MRLRACLASLLVLAPAADAHAMGFLFGGEAAPTELRVALASADPQGGNVVRVVWISAKLGGVTGPVALVVPAPKGTALDLASPAFFEGLETSTAPRIVPPLGVDTTCPGAEGEDRFSVEGDTSLGNVIALQEIKQFATASELSAWVSASGLLVSADFEARAANIPAEWRWVALRFDASGELAVTPTLRLRLPPADASLPFLLPLSFSEARANPMRLVLYGTGDGRAAPSLDPTSISTAELAFAPAGPSSNYDLLRGAALASPSQRITEAASHGLLAESFSFQGGAASVPGFAEAYFTRAQERGDTSEPATTCVARAAQTAGQASRVASACPRASLGVVAGSAACEEEVVAGEIDPSSVRCGRDADDLAFFLSGNVPLRTWLTRDVAMVPPGTRAADLTVTFEGQDAAPVSPVIDAAQIDFEGCENGSSTASTTAGGGPGDPNGNGNGNGNGAAAGGSVGDDGDDGYAEPVYGYEGCACDPTLTAVAIEASDDGGDGSEDVYTDDDSCSGDASDSSDEACSGDASDSSDEACDPGADYETSDSSCDAGDGTESSDVDCSGGDSSSSDSCSSGDGEDCRIASRKGKRLKFSQMTFVLGAVMLLSRRLSRKRKPAR